MRFLADENLNRYIVAGLARLLPQLDLVRVQEVNLMHTADPVILAWAAQERRILLTHDAKTMTRYAYERIAAGLTLPGVLIIPDDLTVGAAIDELHLIVIATVEDEWQNRVEFLPIST